MSLRPPAVPLITVDPYFSIWSFNDNLYDGSTRHWTGKRNSLMGMIKIDGEIFRFMGKVYPFEEDYYTEPLPLPQTALTVKPVSTEYIFENNVLKLHLRFMTPLFTDDLSLMSRPASYISYSVETKDGGQHDISLYFDIAAECCTDTQKQDVILYKGEGSIYCGNAVQNILGKSGDDVRIDWGYLHLARKDAFFTDMYGRQAFAHNEEIRRLEPGTKHSAQGQYPVMAVETKELAGTIIVGYDDIKSIEYFGKHLDGYYKKDGTTFEQALTLAKEQKDEIFARAEQFNDSFLAKAAAIDGKYADITALAYRQAIAAHKLVWDGENVLFMSKECYSNGCIATVDITYPSIPLFLLYNTELIKGMLRPIFKYAQTAEWEYDFAPHDAGCYPLANGQVYGQNKLEFQMPVEECANVLISTAALCKYEGSISFAEQNRPILDKWAKYLTENGYNPGNQLCTDDFAGHFAHNCNLSIKAIMGIAAYGDMFADEKYTSLARELAARWKVDACEGDHYKLAFDKEGTWSLKYNIVWDKILHLGIFDDDIFKTETAFYLTKLEKYGVPLDNRANYTKADWLMWTTVMTEDTKYKKAVFESIWNMLNDTQMRVPITDWYYCSNADQRLYRVDDHLADFHWIGFQNRSVVGGLFINML